MEIHQWDIEKFELLPDLLLLHLDLIEERGDL